MDLQLQNNWFFKSSLAIFLIFLKKKVFAKTACERVLVRDLCISNPLRWIPRYPETIKGRSKRRNASLREWHQMNNFAKCKRPNKLCTKTFGLRRRICKETDTWNGQLCVGNICIAGPVCIEQFQTHIFSEISARTSFSVFRLLGESYLILLFLFLFFPFPFFLSLSFQQPIRKEGH